MQDNFACCPICYSEYDQEKRLPRIIISCGHTLCTQCLETLLSGYENRCPLDKAKFTSDQSSIKAFPVNYALRQVIEDKFLGGGICLEHNEEFRMVCMTDKVRICEYCLSDKHQKHEVKPLKVFKTQADEKKRKLEVALEKLDAFRKDVSGAIEENREGILKVIKDKFKQLKWLLAQHEQELIYEVNSIFNVEKNSLNKTIGMTSSLRKALDKKISSLKEAFKSDSFFNQLQTDFSESLAEIEQIISRRSPRDLANELRQIHRPHEILLQDSVENLTRLELPLDSFANDLKTALTLRNDPNLMEIVHHSFTASFVEALFNVEQQDSSLRVTAKNIDASTAQHELSLSNIQNWQNIQGVSIKLCENDFTEEHVQALFYIWRKMENVSSLGIQFVLKEEPYRGKRCSLVSIFPLILWKSRNLARLKLDLQNCKVVGDDNIIALNEEVLSKMVNLKSFSLNLFKTKVTKRGFEEFYKNVLPLLKNLEEFEFDLSQTIDRSKSFAQVFMQIEPTNRYVLRLQSFKNELESIHKLSPGSLMDTRSLKFFELDVGEIDIQDDHVEPMFPVMENLKQCILNFSGTKISDKTLAKIGENILSKSQQLEVVELNLTGSLITDLGVASLLGCIPRIQNLAFYIGNSAITDGTIRAFIDAFGDHFDALECLDLSFRNTNITEEGIIPLFKSMRSIKHFNLSLSVTKISDRVIHEFVQNSLVTMQALENFELYAYETDITDQSIISVLQNIKGVKYFSLNINNTKVSDECVQYFLDQVLPSMDKLQKFEIDVSNTAVTDKTLKKLLETRNHRQFEVLLD